MFHEGATTRLILPSGLSRQIPVSFFFRQGDCIAGDLFCLNQEPLLRMLRLKLKGIRITNFKQKHEAYMENIVNVSTDVADLGIFNSVFSKFEAQSGAMLCRDSKSKAMGLGQWRGKTDWPPKWVHSVNEMEILGFKICPQYSGTLKSNWEAVFSVFLGKQSDDLPTAESGSSRDLRAQQAVVHCPGVPFTARLHQED